MKNERKLNELIRAAEELPGITPPEDFADRILSEVDASTENTIILFEAALPKFAWAALFIGGLFPRPTNSVGSDLSAATQISAEPCKLPREKLCPK